MNLQCSRCPHPITGGRVANLIRRSEVASNGHESFMPARMMQIVCNGCLEPGEDGYEAIGRRQQVSVGPQLDPACWELLLMVAADVTVYRKHERWHVAGSPQEHLGSVTWVVSKLRAAGLVDIHKLPRTEWKGREYHSWLLMTDEGREVVALRQREPEGAGHGLG